MNLGRHRHGRRFRRAGPFVVSSGWGPTWAPDYAPVVVQDDGKAEQAAKRAAAAEARIDVLTREAKEARRDFKIAKWVAIGAAVLSVFAVGRSGK